MPKILGRNEQEVRNIIMPRIHRALEDVADKIIQENRTDVFKYFYGQYRPNVYRRSYEFADAWDWDEINESSDTVESEFGFNPDLLSYGGGSWPTAEFQHGSPQYGDFRTHIADVLYGIIPWGNYFGVGPWQNRGNTTAFDKLVEKLDKKKFDQWMKAAFKRHGLYVE